MDAVYDADGSVVGWHRDPHLYTLDGSHIGFVNGENIYGHRGEHRGVFKKGLFRDHSGAVVAFKRGATGGPLLPIPAIAPIPPAPGIPPIPAIPEIAPIPSIPSLGWSDLKWEEFVGD